MGSYFFCGLVPRPMVGRPGIGQQFSWEIEYSRKVAAAYGWLSWHAVGELMKWRSMAARARAEDWLRDRGLRASPVQRCLDGGPRRSEATDATQRLLQLELHRSLSLPYIS